jgi:hypothetical protein
VADDEERPARTRSSGRLGQDRRRVQFERRVDEQREHEVEGLLSRPGAQVRSLPPDPVADPLLGGVLGGTVQGDLRDVDARDGPPAPGEPDRGRARARAELERGARSRVREGLDDVRMRAARAGVARLRWTSSQNARVVSCMSGSIAGASPAAKLSCQSGRHRRGRPFREGLRRWQMRRHFESAA